LSNRETADVSEPLLFLLLSCRVAFHKGGRKGKAGCRGEKIGRGERRKRENKSQVILKDMHVLQNL
jgi:hypothetical protein